MKFKKNIQQSPFDNWRFKLKQRLLFSNGFFFVVPVFSILLIVTNVQSSDAAEVRVPGIGTNLEGITDFSGDWPFINRMKSARKWITFDATGQDKTWDTKIPVPVDETGYPLQIPFDPDKDGPLPPQGVRTFLFNGFEHYPTGTYSVIFKGSGRIHFRVNASCPHLPNGQCVFTKPGEVHKFEVEKASRNGIRLKILESNVDDPIRDIRVLMPGFGLEDQVQIFHPLFIERLRGFRILRFMDWASTNHSQIRNWQDRVPPDYVSFAHKGKGVPLEYMIALANQVGADPWFTMPTYASDDYIRQSARLIDRLLDPKRKVYLEYSNEVWNGIFPQEDYATDKGKILVKTLGINVGPREASAYFYARRAAEIFKIFEEELSDSRGLVKVVAGQAMNPWVLGKILYGLSDSNINPTGQKADAIAVAFYFGASGVNRLLTKSGTVKKQKVTLTDVEKISLEDIFYEAKVDILSRRKPKIAKHKDLADKYNTSLLAYEGGQSLLVSFGYKREILDAMTKKLISANRDNRMKTLYGEMFNAWFEAGGEDFVNFSYIYQPGRWGMWGALEYQSQPLEQAYKFQVLREEIERLESEFSNGNEE